MQKENQQLKTGSEGNREPEQLSLDFSDYPVYQQKLDRLSKDAKFDTEVYLVKGKKGYAGYTKYRGLALAITNPDSLPFVEFVKQTIEFVNEKLGLTPRFRCIRNEGISEETDNQYQVIDYIKKGIKNGRVE